MSEHEPDWMRDKRLKDEEARMVNLESNVKATRDQTEAIHEMFVEERKLRRAAEEALLKHESDDATKFSSIDSRLQGTQTQLSTITDTVKRIESLVTAIEPRIKTLEDDSTGRSAVTRWLKSTWVQLGIGASVGATLMGLYTLLAG